MKVCRVGRFAVVLGSATILLTSDACPAPPGIKHESIDYLSETEEQKDERMAWWRDARFGMVIHWGLYSVPAGEWNGRDVPESGEWIMFLGQIQTEEYEPLVQQFNPVDYDADEWVRMAKDAGMRYVQISSKHYDGFCLFDSEYTDYDIMSTPYGRNVLAQLRDACKTHDLELSINYSIMDWHHPDYRPVPTWATDRTWEDSDYDRYVDYMKNQLRELVETYDPGILSFDAEWHYTWTRERGRDLYQYVRELKPEILINNRVDKGRLGMLGLTREGSFAGDYGTPEQEIPARSLPGVDWETAMTMNDTWGFTKSDDNWKPIETLIRNLVDVVSKGGNYKLNVGPTANGRIPEPSVKRLAAIGDWMAVNNESIYGTTASPFGSLPFGRVTAKLEKKRLYLHVFDWPEDGVIELPGMGSEVTSARLLTDTSVEIGIKASQEHVVRFSVPGEAPDPIVSVIALKYTGDLVTETYIPRFPAQADGSFVLKGKEATVEGTGRLSYEEEKDCLGFWVSKSNTAAWGLESPEAGMYDLELTWACPTESAGTRVAFEIDDSRIEYTVAGTWNWETFEKKILGQLKIPDDGSHQLRVIPLTEPPVGVMNLRAIRLVPAD